MFRFFILSLLVLNCAQAAAQEVDPNRLETIKQEREAQSKIEKALQSERAKAQKEIQSIKKKLLKNASEIRKLEIRINDTQSKLNDLLDEKSGLEVSILEDKNSLQGLLAALQRIENNPPPALAAGPQDAANAARAGILMSSLSRQMDQRVAELSKQLEALKLIETEIIHTKEDLTAAKQKIESRRESLESDVDVKNKFERGLADDFELAKKKRETLAAEAKSLEDLISSLEILARDIEPRLKPDPNAPDPEPSKGSKTTKPLKLDPDALRFINAHGKLTAPVIGKIIKRYSASHPGLTVKVSSESQVSAPIAGRVDFAGPFKNFDNVVIINVGDGYFVLLTGLDQLYVQNEATVAQGEPIGLMSVNSPSSSELYIEVRKNRSTVDPTPWFGNTFAKQKNG